jgi:hypothetical protein
MNYPVLELFLKFLLENLDLELHLEYRLNLLNYMFYHLHHLRLNRHHHLFC